MKAPFFFLRIRSLKSVILLSAVLCTGGHTLFGQANLGGEPTILGQANTSGSFEGKAPVPVNKWRRPCTEGANCVDGYLVLETEQSRRNIQNYCKLAALLGTGVAGPIFIKHILERKNPSVKIAGWGSAVLIYMALSIYVLIDIGLPIEDAEAGAGGLDVPYPSE